VFQFFAADMILNFLSVWRTAVFWAILCLAGVIVYANTFHAPFVYDDINYITKNDPNVHMTELSWEELQTAALDGKPRNRPLANVSFALNYYFGKENPFGYHVVNLIVHLATGLLLFFLIRMTLSLTASLKPGEKEKPLTQDIEADWMAFLAVLIWLVHPVQTNAVTYMVQRMTSLAAFFYILSMVLYIKGRLAIQKNRGIKGAGYLCACVLTGVCAVFTKQNAGMLPVFILLYEWFFFQDLRPFRSRRWIFAMLAAILVFCVIGYVYLGGHPLDRILSAYQRREFTMGQRVLTELRVIAYYAGLMVFPQPNRLLLDHDYPLSDSLAAPFTTALSAGMIVGILAAVIFLSRRYRLVAFCLIWFLGNLLIESSIIGIEIIYEHRLYLPSMMICLMAVFLLSRWLKWKRRVIPIVVSVALVFGFWTYKRNHIWHTDVWVWRDVAKKSPQKARPLQNQAYSIQQDGCHQKAIKYYQASLSIEKHPAVYFNLGISFMHQKRYIEAADAYLNALKMGYQTSGIHHRLAHALSLAGEFRAAIDQYQNVLKQNPKNARARDQLRGLIQFLRGCRTPIACLSQRIEQQPENMALRFKRGVMFEKRGALDTATADYNYVLSKLSPSDRMLYLLTLNRLAMVYSRTGRMDKARKLFAEGIRLAPKRYQFYYNLAALWAVKGNTRRSLNLLHKAVEKGFSDLDQLKRDHRFDDIRDLSAFKRMAAAIRNR